jgi:hypothetical protein
MVTQLRGASALLGLVTITTLFCPRIAGASDVDDLAAQGLFCTATALAESHACDNSVLDDYWIAVGICINESDAKDRAQCFSDARAARAEAKVLCTDQHAARRQACADLGEGRYDPEFEAADFDKNFASLTNPNRYFLLTIGSQWTFRSQTQITNVQVLNRTKLIDDVRCIVVLDEVREDGQLVESTNDWFAQAKNGNVWYCGEETSTFESFKGDQPKLPERQSIDGSFKAGRDGDKPGIIFQANPVVGQFYVEESSLGNAEDATEVLSTNYSFGKNPALDALVPAKLAKALCNGDCVVTRNFSSLEPDTFERKYYAPGIGVFLEIEPSTGEVNRLVKCNVDPRCASLPQP